jgi:hypothetical protein
MSKFEDALWAELEQEHAPAFLRSVARNRRRNANRWLAVAAGVAVLGTAAVIAPAYFGGTPPAYALVDNPDGSVTLTLWDLKQYEEAVAELKKKGIPVAAESLLKDCPAEDRRKIEETFKPSEGVVVTFPRRLDDVATASALLYSLIPVKIDRSGGATRCVIDSKSVTVHTGPVELGGPTR